MSTRYGLVLLLAITMVLPTTDKSYGSMAAQNPDGEQGEQKLPPDVRPDTLSRMPRTKRDDLTSEEDKKAFDEVVTFQPKQLTSRWLGPTGTRLQVPAYAVIYNKQDGMLLRNRQLLEPKYVELVIAVATRETNNREEWLNHNPDATRLLGHKVLEVIRTQQPTTGLDAKDAVVIQYGRELFHQAEVTPKTFAALQSSYGKKSALLVTLIMCYYESNVLLMRAYDQHMDTSPSCSTPHSGCLDAKHPPSTW